jgi:iron complex outermembrane receptor protein
MSRLHPLDHGIAPAIAAARRWLLAGFVVALPVVARAETSAPVDLTQVRLEDLMNMEVTSVSRHGQRLFQTASAITVLDAETIRRSGATCVPEVLRLVPGLDVQRISANMWAISARGFAKRLADKMLVLVDGRSVYTPSFSGTYWDAQDLPLDNVERIEVIRGPGATAWGANAVNGVINVITRHARDTHGLFVGAEAGNRDRALGSVRWGGSPRSGMDVRAWVRGTRRDGFDRSGGGRANDAWSSTHGGFRLDWQLREGRTLLAESELRQARTGGTTVVSSLDPPAMTLADFRTGIHNGHALVRWEERWSGRSDLTVQAWFDRESRDDRIYLEDVRTTDLEARWHAVRGAHEIVAGAGARSIQDRSRNTADVQMFPEREDQWVWSGFVQDEVTLVPSRVRFTLGAKVERHEATGAEVQPNVRALWTPDDRSSVWAAWSRAVRTPSRLELAVRRLWDVRPGAPPIALKVLGSPTIGSERLDAWEVGYRLSPVTGLSVDATAYVMEYTGLRSFLPGTPTLVPGPPTYLEVLSLPANGVDGRCRGLELSGVWTPAGALHLRGGATWSTLETTARMPQLSDDATAGCEGSVPRVRVFAMASASLPRGFDVDVTAFAVERLPYQHVPAYGRLDAGLGWSPSPAWQFSVLGQNLTAARHLESRLAEDLVVSSEIPRSFLARVSTRIH